MWIASGLPRDPFAQEDEGANYWESQARRALRREAERILKSGHSLFVHGPPGSGRRAFLARIASSLHESGSPVVWATRDGEGESLLGVLFRRLVGQVPPEEKIAMAEGVYAALLRGFWHATPIIVLPEPWRWPAEDADELETLLGLAFMGRPLCVALLTGAGVAPLHHMQSLPLARFKPQELETIIRHRLSLSGKPDALPAESIERAAGAAKGVGEALGRASDFLSARMFLEIPEAGEEKSSAPPPGGGLFSAEEIGEVASLLAAISSKKNP